MSERLRILFLAANPTDAARLRLDDEYRLVRQRMRDNVEAGNVELRLESAARLEDLLRALAEYKPHVVHFAGHGNDEAVCLENDEGLTAVLTKEQLAALLELLSRHVRLVVLNACRSAPQTGTLARAVDYVVGTNVPVADNAALRFTADFYTELALGGTVREAFHKAAARPEAGGCAGQYAVNVREGVDESRPLLPPAAPPAPRSRITLKSPVVNVRNKAVFADNISIGQDAPAPDVGARREGGVDISIETDNFETGDLYNGRDYKESR
jgi:hypothetical protein